jgi:type II secretory ATPase GspE/PulE/Tfp pilus assembly ATPase PilB-like protein
MSEGQEKSKVEEQRPNNPVPLQQLQEVLEDQLELGERGTVLAIDTMISQAVHHGASDFHLEPWRDCVMVRYRLDGTLHEVALLSKRYQERLVARIKVLSNMVIYQKELPQDGRVEAHKDRLGRSFRASTFPTIHGEKAVIRILDHKQDRMQTASLGFRDEVVKSIHEIVSRPQGALLLTGPSSAGKSTTIYALLRELMRTHSDSRHIVTIEDPVEYQMGRIGQTQINPQMGFTFEIALRSMLRQDPDVIMVGEIRDTETARMAIQAGLTGHFLISTIHSGTAAGVFARLLDMGIEPFLAASAITGVLAQRLVRKICEYCIEEHQPERALIEMYGIPVHSSRFYQGEGCSECRGLGYSDRQAIGELMRVNEEIGNLVLTRAQTRTIHDAAVRNGMVTLIEDGIDKVLDGVTSLEELHMVVPPPDDGFMGEAAPSESVAPKKKSKKNSSKKKSKTRNAGAKKNGAPQSVDDEIE